MARKKDQFVGIDQPVAEPVAQLAVSEKSQRAIEKFGNGVESENVGDDRLGDAVEVSLFKEEIGLENQRGIMVGDKADRLDFLRWMLERHSRTVRTRY